MSEFLQEDERNVVVVHWNAGKGRTGTSIAWFLVYCGLANNATEAINYYGWKRFSTGKGVTQPWQLRYIHYFEAAYKRKVLWSVPKILECIILTTIPKINQNGCKPYVDILNGDYKCIYTTKNSINLKKYKAGPKETEEYNLIKIYPEKKNLIVSGDAHFLIKHKGSFNNTSICRFSINTGFCSNEVEIPREQVSPDSVAVSKKFHDKFKITLILKDYCDVCTSQLPLESICEKCKLRMTKATKEWEEIYAAYPATKPTKEFGEKLWFYDDVDYYEVVNKKLTVKWEQYNLLKEEQEQDRFEGEEVKEQGNENGTWAAGKGDRNTMVFLGDELEKQRVNGDDYFRSVNEFDSIGGKEKTLSLEHKGDSTGSQNKKFSKDPINPIRELSSSSNSVNSHGSELDYRERRRISSIYIEKFRSSVSRLTDPNAKKKKKFQEKIDEVIEDPSIAGLELTKLRKRSSSVINNV